MIDRKEDLIKEIENELKLSNGKITKDFHEKIKTKIQKILFFNYVQLAKNGKAFDLAKVSKQMDIYKRKNPKDTSLSFYHIKKDYTDYSDLFGIITNPKQFFVSDEDVDEILNDPISIYGYVNEGYENLSDNNKEYYLRHKENNSDIGSRSQSLKDIQKLIKFSEIRVALNDTKAKMHKDSGFKAGIEKLKYSIMYSKSEKEENKILRQVDIER
ncbi:MAG: hypothetical protein ACI4N3_01455 [Alphaproteobacteria bacterium]